MSNKPTTAFALSIVGAIFVLLGGISVLVIGALFSAIFSFVPTVGNAVGGGISIVGAIGILSGLIMLAGSVLMLVKPDKHALWGALVLVFACVSWVGAIGGFALGFILGLIGGILAIVWKPGAAVSVPVRNVTPAGQRGQVAQQQTGAYCVSCGAELTSGASSCKKCSAPV